MREGHAREIAAGARGVGGLLLLARLVLMQCATSTRWIERRAECGCCVVPVVRICKSQ